MNTRVALQQYQNVGKHSAIEDASAHKLILMLLTGAQDRISSAMGFIDRHEPKEKWKAIGTAMNIIEGLRASLDYSVGSDITANLESLYEYMNHRLILAQTNNDKKILVEVNSLLKEITSGWVGIADQVK